MAYKPIAALCESCFQYFAADKPGRRFCSIVCRNEAVKDGNYKTGRIPISVPEGSRWCNYHQQTHSLGAFTGAERTCREGRTLVHVRNTYQLSEDKYLAMIGNVCPICETRTVQYVDHDHRCCSGKKSCGNCVRGMLCPPCNTSIAALGDDISVYIRAMKYLGLLEDTTVRSNS